MHGTSQNSNYTMCFDYSEAGLKIDLPGSRPSLKGEEIHHDEKGNAKQSGRERGERWEFGFGFVCVSLGFV
jgi:hypothetical protein